MRKRLQSKSSLSLTIALGTIALAGCQNTGVSEKPIQPALEDLPPWNIGDIQQIYKVSAIADSGSGTLREAIELANASPGTDRIVFESDDDLYRKPQTIHLDSALPVITDNLVIDGYIDDMLWKASGVTISGNDRIQILEVQANAKVKLKHLTLANGQGENGGAVNNNGELVVDSCTLSNNGAGNDGGAIHSDGLRTIIINSTFYENNAGRYGGAVANKKGLVTSTNNTFTDNTSTRGGALYNSDRLAMVNSILANSKAEEDCYSNGTVTTNHYNIIESETGCGTPYSSEDPSLKSPNLYNGPIKTIPLGGRSPAVNYGDNDSAVNEYGDKLKWDQRGNGDPRYAAGIIDIGAFETQANNKLEVDTVEDVDYRWCIVFKNDCSLSGALLLSGQEKRFHTITFHPDIFSVPTTLRLPASLPDINTPVLIKAMPGQQVTLIGQTAVIDAIKEHPLISFENIQLDVEESR